MTIDIVSDISLGVKEKTKGDGYSAHEAIVILTLDLYHSDTLQKVSFQQVGKDLHAMPTFPWIFSPT